jgi:hypothetical protein
MSIFDIPRYKENPIYIFFENYILYILNFLPEEKYTDIQEMDLQKTFKTKATEWPEVIEETLDLSKTIEVAIWDLWIKNNAHYENSNDGYVAFSQDFTDHYMKEDTKVDVWTEKTLDQAVNRVETYWKQKL